MIRTFSANTIGVISVIGYFINTVFWFIPIIILSLLKLLPIATWQKWLSYPLDACASNWIRCNNVNQRLTGGTRINVSGLEDLSEKDWYLVISNHQSWVDILVLQRIFVGNIPFLKFFLKQELIWVPILGLAWWALDFPFMRRYSKSFLAKHPHMKGKDMETTRKACQKFATKPVSVMNFVEGTRITEEKQRRQKSPFSHLLKPKAGGIAFVLSAMGDQLNKLVDVTIHYPDGVPSYWDFVCGNVRQIEVHVDTFSIQTLFDEGIFSEHYFEDVAQRTRFQSWLNALWHKKDEHLQSLKEGQSLCK
ncbi:acyltransferase [Alteromonas sediminis]|uniref:Acyltransferase n=1 Tax=Alteromonas sediminis TaxID=2259342 RepID=A0A3N5Y6V3_9ALTE|nr:acyltransferase [Alteromonas sediminis]RPJ66259.1 acyltransferase [Alteromonas sediminis]